MTERQQERRQLLDQIDALLKEAYGLPKAQESWERREEIDWEILNLCRQISDLSAGPIPYWLEGDAPDRRRDDPPEAE